MSIDEIHDWLLKSWLGVLATAVIGAFCYALFSRLFGRFLWWFTNTIPATVRSLSRQTTMFRIDELKLAHNNTYMLLNAVVSELSMFGLRTAIALIICIPLSAVERHFLPIHVIYHADPHIISVATLYLYLIFNAFGMITASLAQSSLTLFRLSRGLRNFDSTMERLKLHLKDLDVRDGRAQP